MRKYVFSCLLIFSSPLFAANETVTLQSSDGQEFKVDLKVIEQSGTIKNLIEDSGMDHPIPLPNINGKTLALVIEWMKADHEATREAPPKPLAERINSFWQTKKASDFQPAISAINFLDIRSDGKADLLNILIKFYALKLFKPSTLEALDKVESEDFTRYEKENLTFVPDLRRLLVSHLGSATKRIFLNNSVNRVIDAQNQIDLTTALIAAYIERFQTPSAKNLPKPLFRALEERQLVEKVHFGPWPRDWAIWPAHCRLPSNPNYDMYSDDAPEDRFLSTNVIIFDQCTYLTWAKKSALSKRQDDARSLCASFNTGKDTSWRQWRLPTRIELLTISDIPVKVRQQLGLTGEFWTSTKTATNKGTFSVNLDTRTVFTRPANSQLGVFCVNGPAVASPSDGSMPNYEVVGDIAIDNFTGKQWQRNPATERTRPAAQTSCNASKLGGHNDWRLPTVKELASIVDTSTANPAIDTDTFPRTSAGSYWVAHGNPIKFNLGASSKSSGVSLRSRCVR